MTNHTGVRDSVAAKALDDAEEAGLTTQDATKPQDVAAAKWGWPPALGSELERAARWRELASRVFAPIVASGPDRRVNRELVRALGEHGVLEELFEDRADGPRQVSAVRLCLAKESLGERSTAAEDALGLQGLGFYPIYRWGSNAQVESWYQPIVSGEAVAAFAMTEPEAGSDAGALRLRAERRDGGWSLSGSKIWISNAPDADVYTVFARTGETSRTGITAFIVPGDAPGLSGEPLNLIVSHPVGTLEFDDVYVPDEAVIGEVGTGWTIGLGTLDLFRMSVGAFGLGVGQAALLATIRHVRQREQFGAPLAAQPVVGHRLADLATRLAAARLLVYHAALAYDAGVPITELAAMAKSLSTETAQEVVDGCLQLHGARGLEEGHLLGHLYREVRAPRIYEGTTEILRHIVARGLLGLPER